MRLLSAALLLLLLSACTPSPAPSAPVQSPVATSVPNLGRREGQMVTLSSPMSFVPLFVGTDTLQEFFRAVQLNDELGVQRLLESGRVCALQPGVGALVLEDDRPNQRVQVRIQNGPHCVGEAGWVHLDWTL